MTKTFRGWECTTLELKFLEHWGDMLEDWQGAVHPMDHALAANCGWVPTSERSFGKEVEHSPPLQAHVYLVREREWGFRRRSDGHPVVCHTIVTAMARAATDVRNSGVPS